MESTNDRRCEPANGAVPLRAGVALAEARVDSRPPPGGATTRPDHRGADVSDDSALAISPPASLAPLHPWRRRLLWAATVAGLALGAYYLAPTVKTMLDTVATDDAYVNSHVTYVAPRVAGQVSRVLVEDNERVNKGDLLVELDKEPYEVRVDIKKAALVAAEAELMAARAQARGILAQAGSLRWKLQRSIEDVDDSVALLRARVAALRSKEASFDRAGSDLVRARALYNRHAISREEFDRDLEQERTAAAAVKQALEEVHEARVALGLPPHPDTGELTDVPADINQTFSGVRQALADVNQTMAQLGFPLVSVSLTPQQALDDFTRRDKEGNINRILERMVPEAPAVRQAEAKRLQAVRDLSEAELELRYCKITSETDGVVTSRNVNPGNHISAGQSLMAIRSLTEIWIDANFKETQLADLRIGQRVRCEVDMYGGRKEFEGRITGFTMGTGQTLSLLPPQNATGNYVKIVQRLPVRITLADYDPDKTPLFAGLSVVPYVYFKEPTTGPNAGAILQPRRLLPQGPSVSKTVGASRPAAPAPEGRGGA